MHMTQHLLLLDLAPICLILGLTKVLLRPATRRLMALERAAGPLAHPVFAVFLYVGVMWFWHVPAMYDAALEHDSVHVLEHMMFLSAGLLYWWHLLSPIRSRLRTGAWARSSTCCRRSCSSGCSGIGLTFTPDPLYDYYEQRGPIWGLTAGGDQELAGAIMALEQSIVMGIALAYLFVRALEQSEREQRRRERLEDLREAEAERGRVSPRARCPSARTIGSSPASIVDVPWTTTPRAEGDVAAHRQRVAARTSEGGPAGKRGSKSSISLKWRGSRAASGATPRRSGTSATRERSSSA